LIIQLPQVQTFLVGRIINGVSENLDGEITFEKIQLKPFTTLVLKNVAIVDKNPAKDALDPEKAAVDTFFRAKYIIARFSLEGLADPDGFHIRKAYVADARMNLVLEDDPDDTTGTGTDNLSRIFKLKKGQPKKDPSPDEIFHIGKVEINNMAFALINHKTEKTPYMGGINWNDLDVTDIDLKAKDLMFKGGVMSGEVRELSFKEKSGFDCKSITGQAKVGNGKTIVENLKLVDNWSNLDIPLYMMSYSGVEAFADYINAV
jgi:hypothetical protein